MKKNYLKSLKVFLTLLLLCGVSNAWGANYTKLFTIKSADVVSNSDYQKYTRGFDEVNNIPSFIITFGGNNKSVGTNSGKRSNCNLSTYSKYAVSPVTTSDVASAFVSTSSISDVAKISYTFNGGSNQTNTNVYLIYSSDGNTFSQLSLTSGTQGATISSGTAYEFSKCSGYFGLLFKATNTSGAWRIDDVNITFYKKSTTSTEAYTITFNAGSNGTCSTTELTEASAGAGVTLPGCTANTGYVFKGWSTTENGTTPDAGKVGETYKPSSNCTLYAVYTKTYVLTITQPEAGGTLTVKNGDTQLETGATVEVGTNLTCEVTDIPEGKRFSRFYAKWGEGDKENKYKGTNPTTFDNLTKENLPENISALQIYVSYQDLKKYTINYMVNGVNTDAQENVYEGTALVFPTVNDFGGKVFVGWSETEITEATDVKPTLVETTDLTATANATYYAVFATKRVGEEKSEELTNDAIKSWGKLAYNTEKTYEGTDLNYSIFGFTDADDRQWIQLKKDKGVYVKITAPSNIKKVDVKITSASNSSGGINDISKHTAFSGMVGLVTTDCSFSTSSENVGSTEEVEDYIATISVSGEAKELYLKVSTGARVWSITTHYGTPDSYSGYCTIVASRTQDVEIASSGYSSFSSTYAVTIPEGVTAYYATGVEGNKVSMIEVEGGVIPANEGVIIKGVASQEYTFIETVSDKTFNDNKLVAVSERIEGLAPEVTVDDVTYKNYVFSGGQFHPFTSGATISVGAGKAYLQIVKPSDENAKFEMSFGDVTGINTIDNGQLTIDNSKAYNLNGVRVNPSTGSGQAYKGIVIMNGKKYISK